MPQEWVDRDDRIAGDCPAGPVHDGEPLARLLNAESYRDGQIQDVAFQTKYLLRPKEPINNRPGERHGESLHRSSGLNDEDLRAVSNSLRPTSARGAAVALAADIRDLSVPGVPSVQLFYIYEDPLPDEPRHAVIRYTDNPACKSASKLARKSLIALFQKRIVQGDQP